MQHEISQQGLKARLVKASDGLVAPEQAKQAGQVEVWAFG
jgi:hypothetical protein